MGTLKEKILNEMIVDHSDALEKNFERVKKLIAITKTGKVDITIDKAKLGGEDLIRLYCMGKLYSKESGLSKNVDVHYSELMDELGIKKGSVLPWLKNLRDNNFLKSEKKGIHYMPLNMVERTIDDINKKLGVHNVTERKNT